MQQYVNVSTDSVSCHSNKPKDILLNTHLCITLTENEVVSRLEELTRNIKNSSQKTIQLQNAMSDHLHARDKKKGLIKAHMEEITSLQVCCRVYLPICDFQGSSLVSLTISIKFVLHLTDTHYTHTNSLLNMFHLSMPRYGKLYFLTSCIQLFFCILFGCPPC